MSSTMQRIWCSAGRCNQFLRILNDTRLVNWHCNYGNNTAHFSTLKGKKRIDTADIRRGFGRLCRLSLQSWVLWNIAGREKQPKFMHGNKGSPVRSGTITWCRVELKQNTYQLKRNGRTALYDTSPFPACGSLQIYSWTLTFPAVQGRGVRLIWLVRVIIRDQRGCNRPKGISSYQWRKRQRWMLVEVATYSVL